MVTMLSLTNSLTVVVAIAVVTDIIVSYRMGVEDAGFEASMSTSLYKSRAIAGTTARCAQYMSAQIIM